MGCIITQRVLDGKLSTVSKNIVKDFGVGPLVRTTSSSFNPTNISMDTHTPNTIAEFIEKFDAKPNEVLANYALTGLKVTEARLKAIEDSGAVLSDVLPKGMNNTKVAVDAIRRVEGILRSKDAMMNPNPKNRIRKIAIAATEADTAVEGSVLITQNDILNLRTDMKKHGDAIQDDAAYELLISSALARGYDVVISAGISTDVLAKSASTLSGKFGRQVELISDMRAPSNIKKVLNIDSYLEEDGKSKPAIDIKPKTSNPLLNKILTDRERTVLERRAKVSQAHTKVVFNALTKVFRKLAPNLNVTQMTKNEIIKTFGDSFANKSGFMFNGKIVFNIDKFNSETAFHEFSHFFMAFLKENNPEGYNSMLEAGKNSPYAKVVRRQYSQLPMEISEETMLEEIAVREIGMNADGQFKEMLRQNNLSLAPAEVVDAAVDDFVTKFANKLINTKVEKSISLFDTVADIVNFQIENAIPGSTVLMTGINSEAFLAFMFPNVSMDTAFKSLVSNGRIRLTPRNGKGLHRVVLTDNMGNIVNVKGEMTNEHEATYYYNPNGHLDKRQRAHNKKTVDSLTPYLAQNEEAFDIKFDIGKINTPEEVANKVLLNTKGIKLTEDDSQYTLNGKYYTRATTFVDSAFSEPTSEIEFIHKSMYFEQRSKLTKELITDKDLTEEEKVVVRAVIEQNIAEIFEKKGTKYTELYDKFADIFETKRTEGTLLHGLAEMMVRTMNYAQQLDFNTKGTKTYDLFIDHIGDAIANNDRARFKQYFDEYFFNRIENQGTQEFDEFKKNYDLISEQVGKQDSVRIRNFMTHFKTIFKKDMVKGLVGPLKFLPEVRLASDKLGIAGTIDLLIIDANGIAHVVDYKTKENNKEGNWDYASDVYLSGTMAAYTSNAKRKASIQTSLYNLMLNDLGIETGPAKVVYVAGDLVETQEFNDSDKRIRYNVMYMKMKDLTDLTGELQRHYIEEVGVTFDNSSTFGESAVAKTIDIATGGQGLNIASNLDKAAESILDEGLRIANSALDISAIFGGKSSGGLKITLYGGIKAELTGTSREERLEEIKDLLKNKLSAAKHESEIESMFYSGKTETKSKDQRTIYSTLLAGASPVTHTIKKLSSSVEMGTAFGGTVLLTNKMTGEARVIVYNPADKRYLEFGKEDRNRRNIFGQFITNDRAKQLLPTTKWSNSNHNMELFKTGLAIMQMKKKDAEFKVEYVVSNSELSKNGTPRLEDLATILSVTTEMIKIMQESGEQVPAEILELVEDQDIINPRSYIANPLEAVMEFVTNSSKAAPLVDDYALFHFGKGAATLAEVIAAKEEMIKIGSTERMLNALIGLQRSLGHKYATREAKKNSQLWKMIDDSILFLMGHNPNTIIKQASIVSKLLMTASGSSNQEQSTFNRKIQGANTGLRSAYMEYSSEKTVILEGLAKVNGTTLSAARTSLGMKKLFTNLFSSNNTDRKTAFKLKKPSEVNTAEEKAALRYFQKKFEQHAEATMGAGKVIPEGWMPLIPKSKISVQADESNPLKMASTLLLGVRANRDMFGEDEGGAEKSADLYFITKNTFEGQVPTQGAIDEGAVQWSGMRRSALGIDKFGTETADADNSPLNMIEDNLENVLDAYVMGSLETEHYKPVAAFGKALLMNVERFETLSNTDRSATKEIIEIIQRKVINHETSEKAPPFLSTLNKFTTTAYITGTVSQALLETFTNPLVTTANYMADKIYGTMFKGQRHFSAKSYAKAVRMVTVPGKQADLIEKIDLLYGITSSDNSDIKQVLSQLEGKSLFNSDKLMYFNKIMLDSWQKITLAAWLIEAGSLAAYKIDAYGNLKYDETKDRRFNDSASNEEGRIFKHRTMLEIKKALQSTPGALTGSASDPLSKRSLKWGLAPQERNEIKALIAEVYASMDEESKSLITFYTGTSLLSKMKTWIFSKAPRYFKKPMTAEENFSAAKLVKVPNPNNPGEYIFEWRGQEAEGIIYTLKALYYGVADQKMEGIKNGYNMKEHQKENLSKLLADVGMWMVMSGVGMGLWSMLDDEDKKNPMISLLHDRYTMATEDLFLLKSLTEMTTGQGSMFVSLSAAKNALTAAGGLIISGGKAATGNAEAGEFGSSVNTLLKSTLGLYKSAELVYDQITYGDEKK